MERGLEATCDDGVFQRRVLEFSLICADISGMRQGLKTFRRLENSVHQELDMREPRFDIRLHYMGGILRDKKNIRKAEHRGLPVTLLKPGSWAAQCMAHIAKKGSLREFLGSSRVRGISSSRCPEIGFSLSFFLVWFPFSPFPNWIGTLVRSYTGFHRAGSWRRLSL
jgi:hypothetical protein